LGTVKTTPAVTSLCAENVNTVTPSVTITNSGSSTITGFSVDATVNGTPQTQTFTGSLSNGQTTNVSWPAINVSAGGQYIIAYGTPYNINGGSLWDINPVNNYVANDKFSLVGPTVAASPYSMGFEASPVLGAPDKGVFGGAAYLNVVNQSAVSGATVPVGGFAASAKSIKYDYFNAPTGSVMTYYTEKLNPSALTTPTLRFSHAYRQYNSENDALRVKISTDCGVTWTTLYDKQGSTLMTAPAGTSSFAPTASQWASNSVDLAAYASQSSVIFAFEGTSNYGNNLYVDDIMLANSQISIDNVSDVNLSIYPNPATDQLFVDLTGTQMNNGTLSILDQNGRVVQSDVIQQAGILTLNVQNLASGIYVLAIRNDMGVVINKSNFQKAASRNRCGFFNESRLSWELIRRAWWRSKQRLHVV
jgi:hypothetical protein